MSQANPWEYLQQTIDAEIISLEGSIRALKHRRNALAPVSSLPTEVMEAIFSLLRVPSTSPPFTIDGKIDHLAWLRVAHVCHQWRKIALNQPLFWSHVDFNTISSAGAAEILARAKTVPLHFEAKVPSGSWDDSRFDALRKELQDHVSHIHHLDISAEDVQLKRTLDDLTSPAPTLEYLSLSRQRSPDGTMETGEIIPDTLFNGFTPRLSCLELYQCPISWESPLLSGLKHLHIGPTWDRPSLSVWLDALDGMPHLMTLALDWSSPIAPDAPPPSHIERTVTLPSLTLFSISSRARSCGLALAHLVLPALTSLCLKAESFHPDGCDVPEILPYVIRHAHGLQHTQPLQSVFARNNTTCVEIIGWTLPDIDIDAELSDMDADLPNKITIPDTMHSIQVAFSVMNRHWYPGIHTEVFDAMLADLPLDNLVALAVQRHTRLDKQFWLRNAPQFPLLQRMRLGTRAARGFREMLLQEDNGRRESPLLPFLTKLVLLGTRLSARRTLHLCDALMNRVEQGVPLETLDLSTCVATSRAVELLSEIVVEVLCPEEAFAKSPTMISRWDSTARGLFVVDDNSGVEDHPEYIRDLGIDDVVWDDEG